MFQFNIFVDKAYSMDYLNFLIFETREEWQAWLLENHNRKDIAWLGYYKKKSGQQSISYDESIEEALCYGWVDSLLKRVDDLVYVRKFTPRKKNSTWSLSNVKRVERLTAENRMAKAGLELVKAAKQNGRWDTAYSSHKKTEIPPELLLLLKENNMAFNNFFNFSESTRNRYCQWINSAKRTETREKRLQAVLEFAELNKKAGF